MDYLAAAQNTSVPEHTAPAAHTPGPWQFYADLPSTEPDWHIVTNASRMRVLANIHIEPGNKTDLANAKLIAAAPDLLFALETLAYLVEHPLAFGHAEEMAHRVDRAHAAIAKVR